MVFQDVALAAMGGTQRPENAGPVQSVLHSGLLSPHPQSQGKERTEKTGMGLPGNWVSCSMHEHPHQEAGSPCAVLACISCPHLPPVTSHTLTHVQTLDPRCGRLSIPDAPTFGSFPSLCPV
ncbi:hypothetical protein HJG60_008848 [Phyllostomus discolor]|uniref:Uncharacterized protein n=1 Tax=Phyllostomus discolor TaxID=89673 RepID=A0A833YWK7_9CHIR|nr:hypothetical protein HJG60_008848 [Phyllostomus discolor]